jgi:hypothetical protein
MGDRDEPAVTGKSAPRAKSYEPNSEERAQIAAYVARRKQKPPAPRVTLNDKAGTTQVATDHPLPPLGQTLVMHAIGVTDPDLFDGLLAQMVNASTHGRTPDERGLNFMLAVIRAVEPKDELEAVLAAQMAAVHMATMAFARRLNHVDNIPQQDSASNAFNKLARTFAMQMEALKRYRTGGEQRVTVQHVTVNDGGKAIVSPMSPARSGVGHDRES